ncbi:MAG: M17 family peptidase N-terminal domain-containing protein, partial [Methylococcaceae bacterium]
MDYLAKSEFIENLATPCVVLGFYHKRKLTPAAAMLDARLGGLLEKLLKRDDIEGKVGDILSLTHTPLEDIERIVLV